MSTNSLGNSEARHGQLRNLLRTSVPSETDCDTYLSSLNDYIEAQLAGVDYLSQFAEVALHLDSCLACAEDYARLYELEIAVAENTLPVVQNLPAPNLAFLAPATEIPQTSATATLTDLLSELLNRVAETVRFRLTSELLHLLQPIQSAPVMRAADDARFQELLYKLEPEQLPESAIPMRLAVYRDAEQQEMCLLEITITPPGESWPGLGGRTVNVQFEGTERNAVTDAWGVAAFQDMPLAALSEVEVTFDAGR